MAAREVPTEKVEATVEFITYRGDRTGFTVACCRDGKTRFTAVGIMPDVSPGETLELRGQYVTHKSYGRQFKVAGYAKVLPRTEGAILRYLSRGAVKGIGPATAAKIVRRFGKDTMRVLSEEPQRLCEISGISRAKAEALGEEFRKGKSLGDVISYFAEFGLEAGQSMRIFERLGDGAVAAARENPYRLCEGDIGLDFHLVDGMAEAMKGAPPGAERYRGALLYVLRGALAEGHTRLPEKALFEEAARLTRGGGEEYPAAAAELLAERRLARSGKSGERGGTWGTRANGESEKSGGTGESGKPEKRWESNGSGERGGAGETRANAKSGNGDPNSENGEYNNANRASGESERRGKTGIIGEIGGADRAGGENNGANRANGESGERGKNGESGGNVNRREIGKSEEGGKRGESGGAEEGGGRAGTETSGENPGRYLALWEYDDLERDIAARIKVFLASVSPERPAGDAEISAIEAGEGITYAEKQKEAIRLSLEGGVCVLTGGPGTGKTTAVNAVIKLLRSRGLKVKLAAPTGRAAKRMQSLCGAEAVTIHRLLEGAPGEDGEEPYFGRDESNPLSCDALIVDEMSMVDAPLFDALLKALPLGCRLILVGDADQLPSVGAGDVLRDLLASGAVPSVRLTEIFRQAEKSRIVTGAHRVISGELPDLRGAEDFFFLPAAAGAVPGTVTELCATRLPAAYGYSPETDIQVISPARITPCGTGALNAALQARLNGDPSTPSVTGNGVILRLGDKVMMTRNNYNITWVTDSGEEGAGVFNGEIGVVAEVDAGRGELRARFDDKIALFTEEDIPQLELAYAVTVHKSQGCEFPCVVLVISEVPKKLLYRNLLYTAITRARERLVIVGDAGQLREMVAAGSRRRRHTALGELLEG